MLASSPNLLVPTPIAVLPPAIYQTTDIGDVVDDLLHYLAVSADSVSAQPIVKSHTSGTYAAD
jgi:hypothetical protein